MKELKTETYSSCFRKVKELKRKQKKKQTFEESSEHSFQLIFISAKFKQKEKEQGTFQIKLFICVFNWQQKLFQILLLLILEQKKNYPIENLIHQLIF